MASLRKALEKGKAERATAERHLAADDARFHGRTLVDPEEGGYQSAIGEGWEDDDGPTRGDW